MLAERSALEGLVIVIRATLDLRRNLPVQAPVDAVLHVRRTVGAIPEGLVANERLELELRELEREIVLRELVQVVGIAGAVSGQAQFEATAQVELTTAAFRQLEVEALQEHARVLEAHALVLEDETVVGEHVNIPAQEVLGLDVAVVIEQRAVVAVVPHSQLILVGEHDLLRGGDVIGCCGYRCHQKQGQRQC